MRALLLLALAGCNDIYGLHPVKTVDAQFFDAATSCPAIGGAFEFGSSLDQLVYDCQSYTEAGDRAIALCLDADRYQPHGGPPNGPFTPIAELPRADGSISVRKVQLAADGTMLLFATQNELRTYQLVDGAWTRGADVLGAPSFTSNASRGPDRRILGGEFSATLLRELSDEGGTWHEVRTHSLTAPDLGSAVPLWLSGDALRVLVITNTTAGIGGEVHIRLGERATTTDTFGPLRILTLPATNDVFITDDCSRAYFSGLRSIFYARRR